MKKFFDNSIGRLRLLGFLEGTSLLILVLIGVPMKHFGESAAIVKLVGPVHGGLFLLFVFQTITVAIEQRWSFRSTTWKVLLASFIPFGTFYIDRVILKPIQES